MEHVEVVYGEDSAIRHDGCARIAHIPVRQVVADNLAVGHVPAVAVVAASYHVHAYNIDATAVDTEDDVVGELHQTGRVRSEEHTSELQSLVNLVCRLLLEKKNYNAPPRASR